jgi:hypothetical protein
MARFNANQFIKAGSISASELGANSVEEAKINSGAVTETKIGAGAVTNTKIGNDAVTPEKLDDTQLFLMTGIDFNSGGGALSLGTGANTSSVNIGKVGALTTVQGDFKVNGTTTTIDSNQVHVGDSEVLYNSDIIESAENSDGGMQLKRVTLATDIDVSGVATNVITVASDPQASFPVGALFYLSGTASNDGLYKVGSVNATTITIDLTATELGVKTSIADQGAQGSVNPADPALVRWNESTDKWQIGTLLGGLSDIASASDLSNYVDLTSAQTITGAKTFSNTALDFTNGAGQDNAFTMTADGASSNTELYMNTANGGTAFLTLENTTAGESVGLEVLGVSGATAYIKAGANSVMEVDTALGATFQLGSTTYNAVGFAGLLGADSSGLTNSASGTIQGVLGDLDSAITSASGSNSIATYAGTGAQTSFAIPGGAVSGPEDIRVFVDGVMIPHQDGSVYDGTAGKEGFIISGTNAVLTVAPLASEGVQVYRVKA